MIRGNTSFFITGGTLGQDTPSYVERQADAELYEGLRQGEFCYVLTARQMGKSSLMVRTASRLREDGFSVATLDLTMVGQNLTLEQWYYGLLNLAGRQLSLRAELRAFWGAHPELGPLQRFMQALEQVVLAALDASPEEDENRPSRGLVIFVDEIDSVLSLPFNCDELFAAIRQCYNRRAEEPALRRLTFCLLGVTSPSQLIRDVRTTPFNVGRRIELHDFREAEAQPLAVGLQLGAAGDPLRPPRLAQHLLRRVLHWTAGHPYLTQRLCREVAENPKVRDARGVDRLCRDLFLLPGARSRDDNLLFVQERLVNREDDVAAYLDLYRRIRAGQRVRCDETDPRVPELRLSGIVREEQGYLRVRNRIYHRVFDPAWINARLPDAELHRQLAAYQRGLMRGGALAALVIGALGTLAATALFQTRRAERILAEMQIDRGVARLVNGEGYGLFDLLDAYTTARYLPDIRASAALLWAGWQPLERQRLLSMVGHSEAASAVSFTADGRYLLSGSIGGELRSWRVGSWAAAGPAIHDEEPVAGVAGSPDGSLILAHGEGGARLWERSTGKMIARMAVLPDGCTAAAYRPDGREIATASQKGIHFWEAAAQWHETAFVPCSTPLSLNYSRNGRLLLAGTPAAIQVWDVARRTPLGAAQIPGGAERAAFLAGSSSCVAVSGDQGYAWTLPLRPSSAPAPIGPLGVTQLVPHPTDPSLLAGLAREGISFLRLSLSPFNRRSIMRSGVSQALAFSPDGKLLAGAGLDGSVRVWNVDPSPSPLPRLVHPDLVLACGVRQNGRLITLTTRGRIQHWQAGSQTPTADGFSLPNAPSGASFAPDGERLVVWNEREWCIWNANGVRQVGPIRLPSRIRRADFSADGQRLLVMEQSGKLHLLGVNRSNAHELLAYPDLSRLRNRVMPAVTADGAYLLCPGREGVRIVDLTTADRPERSVTAGSRLRTLAVAPFGHLLAFGASRRVGFVRFGAQAPKTTWLDCADPVQEIRFSPDARLAAVACAGGSLYLWDTTSERLTTSPVDTRDVPRILQFALDGRVVITASRSSVRIWETRTGKPLAEAQRLPGISEIVEWPGRERYLALATQKEVALWKLPTVPTGLREMETLTWATVAARRRRAGEITALGWQELRQLRNRLSSVSGRGEGGRSH